MTPTVVAVIVAVATLSILGYARYRIILRKIHGQRDKTDPSLYVLSYSPTDVGFSNIVAIALALVSKYVPAPLGGGLRLKPRKEQDGVELPLIRLEAPLTILPKDLEAFLRAVRLPGAPRVDASTAFQNPCLLVSLTTPLLLVLLSHPKCPIKPLGAVNTENRFSVHDPEALRNIAALITASRAGGLNVRVEMGGPENFGRRRRRGVEFSVRISVLLNGQTVLTQEMSFLQFLPKSHKPLYVDNSEARKENKEPGPVVSTGQLSINLDTSSPLLYAASSKDFNPIHISKYTAKAFGFRSSIAHGNHVAALVLGSLQQAQSESRGKAKVDRATAAQEKAREKAKESCWNSRKPFAFEIAFQKPMLLPTALDVQWSSGSGSTVASYEVTSKGKLHITGKIVKL